MPSLTVLILARNEENNICDCIKSALFADEVVVIDDFSTDNTKQIAEQLGATVYQHAMNGNWGEQQNFAIDQAKTEWVFFLDADERITTKLADEIKSTVKNNERYAYKVPRLNHVMGEAIYHCGWYPDYGYHLMPRDGFRVEGFVHPTFVHNLPVKHLTNHIIHYTYVSWEQYFNKFNLYTRLAAEKKLAQGKGSNFFIDIVIRPCIAFLKMYVLKSGWRSGKTGFIISALHSFYTMTKYVKLYYLQKSRN